MKIPKQYTINTNRLLSLVELQIIKLKKAYIIRQFLRFTRAQSANQYQIYFKNSIIQQFTMLSFKIFVCTFYGLVSIAQTLNSRFLFRTLKFNFYSTVFMIQRLVIIFINWKMERKTFMKWSELVYIIPYAFIMCTINILSSYCVTIMPLAAFMAFKKFVVFFVLVVGIAMNLPNNFNKIHYTCIACIVFGGLMIGQRDIFRGEIIGYVSSLVYTLFEALSLQYSLHLYEKKSIGPQDLMVANSLLSLPYYIFLIFWEKEYEGMWKYFSEPIHPLFIVCLIFAILLAFSSEYTANTISMKISPFEKASVSNIKDLVLTIVSIKYFKDFILTSFSEIGIFFCLSASVIFSFTLIEKSEKEEEESKHTKYHQIGHEIDTQADVDSETIRLSGQ